MDEQLARELMTAFEQRFPHIRGWFNGRDLIGAAERVLGELEEDTSGCDRWLDRADPADIERLVRFAAALFEVSPCNCQAIPGSRNYGDLPCSWHPRGDSPHYPCARGAGLS